MASPSTARPGEAVNLSFTFAGASPNPKDWVGLFQVGGSSYINWFYVINEPDCQATFYAPTTPGQYEFRYLLNDSNDQLATVTGLTVVSTAGDTKLWDWATRGVGEQRGQVGLRLSFICPANGSPGAVLGTDIYTDDSGICPAAVHAGVISLEQGGTVTIELLGAQQSFTGSTRNGITSVNYGSWPGAFRFVY
jgi:hypothetical protein